MKQEIRALVKKIEDSCSKMLDDRAEDILADLGGLLEEIVNLESELEQMTEEKDEQYDRAETLESELKDVEDKIDAYDKLRELTQAYQLSDSQYHQTEILRFLEEEFNLNLIVAPAKNQ